MGIIKIRKSMCPFCSVKLKPISVKCPTNKRVKGLECRNCISYFFRPTDYWYLRDLAKEIHRKLILDVYYYVGNYEDRIVVENKTKDKQNVNNKLKNKQISYNQKKYSRTQNKTAQNIIYLKPHDRYFCGNYKKGFCSPLGEKCCISSAKCHYIESTKSKPVRKSISKKFSQPLTDCNVTIFNSDEYVSAIVLTDNRKCLYNEHLMVDILAVIKIMIRSSNNEVKDIKIKAAYCGECDEYFVLKSDFSSLKKVGTLLCEVEDRTQSYLLKHKASTIYGNESRIHRMGYNVIKEYGYTNRQREIILANILENTDITAHEIMSIIDLNIARHKNQKNYQEAVRKWINDREFVEKYQLGDIPEVKIGKLIVGKRV